MEYKGKVEAVSKQYGGVLFEGAEKWTGSSASAMQVVINNADKLKGQTVIYSLDAKGKITDIKLYEEPTTSTVAPQSTISDKDRLILRQVALKAAVEFLSAHEDISIPDVLKVAGLFNDWLLNETPNLNFKSSNELKEEVVQ